MVLESKIDDFLTEIRLGVDFFFSAGQKLVLMLGEDPHVFEEIIERSRVSWITMDVLKGFEMIGRRQLAVQAMFLPKHVLNRMIELPIEEQERLLEKPVSVSAGLRQGFHTRVNKPVSQLTRREAKQVFAANGVQSESDQSLGRFQITLANGKATIKPLPPTARCRRIALDENGSVAVEFMKPMPGMI